METLLIIALVGSVAGALISATILAVYLNRQSYLFKIR